MADTGADRFMEMILTSLQFINKDSTCIRPQQREALHHLLSGRDTFINRPTRFGKSLIFELAPLCFDCQRGIALGSSKVLIVSPLITLMDSKIRDLAGRGQKAARLSDRTEACTSLMEANYWFCSPESLQEGNWVVNIRKNDFHRSIIMCCLCG